MQPNLERQSVWRRRYVRFGIVLVVACLTVVLALIINFFILRPYSAHGGNEVWNNKTTPNNDLHQPTTTAPTTQLATQITSEVIDNGLHIPTTFSPNRWIIDSHLITKRSSFAAAPLENGQILVSGGGFIPPMSLRMIGALECEIYSPLSRKWRKVGEMQVPRSQHTLTTLQDGKSVLAIGGIDRIDSYTAEIYDIETDRWTFVSTFMDIDRHHHTSTLLQNGQVLIVGGHSNTISGGTSSVQLYVPLSSTFIKASNLNIPRFWHTATLLSDGLSVLIIGGRSQYFPHASAEVYNAGSWTNATSGMTNARSKHTAVLLLDGNVLVAGGLDSDEYALSSVEIYNLITRSFSTAQPMACARSQFTLTRLALGLVLAAGGTGSTIHNCHLVSELYDPTTGQWISSRLLNVEHANHAAVLLNNSVLIIAGESGYSAITQCERYEL